MTALRQLRTLFGATFYMMYCGTPYIIGAISPYLAAYFQVETSKVQMLMPSIIFLQTLLMPLGGQLAQKCPARLLMSFGSMISIGCTVLASFCPQNNFAAFFALFVGGQGICLGVSYMVPLQLGWKAYPEKSGLASGFIVGGFGLGALVFSFMATKLVNPLNLSSATNHDGLINFDISVTDRVPFMMQALAVGYATVVLLAIVLASEPSKGEEAVVDDNFTIADSIEVGSPFMQSANNEFAGSSMGAFSD
mmetsp:Transcript_34100/g.42155  ORF Transcript_34100/g.42155 Transcript_34100/m.42155 type:complete len:250 (-) Transcript_34100:964-1713(-)